MSKIIVHRDPAKINLAVLDLHSQVGDLQVLPTIAADVNQKAAAVSEATGQAVAAAGTATAAEVAAVTAAGTATAAELAAVAAQGVVVAAAEQVALDRGAADLAAYHAGADADRAEAAAADAVNNAPWNVKDYATFAALPSLVVGARYRAPGMAWDALPAAATNYDFIHASGTPVQIVPVAGVVNLRSTPCAADGVTDDAVHLRSAMSALVRRGGGKLYIPKGKYYLSSGDPRGLNVSGSSGVDEYWAICEAQGGVEVYGDGEETEIIINSERLGQRSHDGKMDVGALFANFRVRHPSNTCYPVPSFAVRDFKVRWTDVVHPSRDYVEGQVVDILGLGGEAYHGIFTADRVTIQNHAGHQAFQVWPVKLASIKNCVWDKAGFAAVPGNTDYSGIYISGDFCEATGNMFIGSTPDKNSTFLEIHTRDMTVHGNSMRGGYTFLNAVSQIHHPSDRYSEGMFKVSDNIAHGISEFVVLWVSPEGRTKTVSVLDNDVVLYGVSGDSRMALFRTASHGPGSQPVDTVVVDGNTVNCEYSGPWDTSAGFVWQGLVRCIGCKRLLVKNNHVTDPPRAFVDISPDATDLTHIEITGNTALNCASRPIPGDEYTAAVVAGSFNYASELAVILIERNRFDVGAAEASHGIYLTNYKGAAGILGDTIAIRGNEVSGATGREVLLFTGAGSTWGPVKLDHTYNYWPDGLNYGDALFAGAGAAIVAGSCARVGTFSVLRTVSNHKVEGQGEATPTGLYWPRGSIIHNTAPAAGGNVGWVCVADGTPGTWKTFGSIVA